MERKKKTRTKEARVLRAAGDLAVLSGGKKQLKIYTEAKMTGELINCSPVYVCSACYFVEGQITLPTPPPPKEKERGGGGRFKE